MTVKNIYQRFGKVYWTESGKELYDFFNTSTI